MGIILGVIVAGGAFYGIAYVWKSTSNVIIRVLAIAAVLLIAAVGQAIVSDLNKQAAKNYHSNR